MNFFVRTFTITAWLALTAAHALAAREPWTNNRVVGSPNPPAPYAVERVFPAQQFQNPIDLAFMPGSSRLFVAELGGKIWSWDVRSNATVRHLVADLRQHHQPFDTILGFAFHPGFATNRFVFINYNEPGGRPLGAHVSRFTLKSLNPPEIDPASERVMLRWISGEHNGCTLAFGNDGLLYISTGDASAPDPPDSKLKTGQDLSDLAAAILRIDVDRTEGNTNYAIPRDNPFINTPGARPEVFAFGLRNPFRMSFDRTTGDLLVGDVGWEQWEMIYRVKAGGNYGWPLSEGPNPLVRTDVKQGPGAILPPLIALPHSEAASITGGQFYHGKRLPKLAGAYLYGDWETGKFWALRHRGDELLSNEELCDTTLRPISFTIDPDGELRILDYNGGLYRFVPSNAGDANLAFPRKLSETGLFSDTAKLLPAAGVLSYTPAATMWSDYASITHHLGVPERQRITTVGTRLTIAGKMWDFPTNTVFARTATLPGTIPRRIETQLMHFDGQAWNGYSYRWNESQTDAELVPASGTNAVYQFPDASAPGGTRVVPWRYLGRAECFRCHNSWAGETLSFNWAQLSDSELQRLAAEEVLALRDKPNRRRMLVNPHDSSHSLESRSRAWLDVNCAGCHRAGAGGAVAIHLNFDKPLNELRAVNEKPLRGDFMIDSARIIAPGEPFRSTLFYRISTEGSGHMPHIGSRLVDERGVELVKDWIASLPGAATNSQTPPAAGKETNQLQNVSDALVLITSMKPPFSIPAGALEHTNQLVRELFERFLPPEQRRKILGAEFEPRLVLSMSGDAVRGRDVFSGAGQCSRCHVIAGTGRGFGPELSGLAKRYNRAQLLEHLVQPSKVIAPEYKLVALTLRDETELSGFVRERSATELVLRDDSLKEHRLSLRDIKETRDSSLSAMPEGLLAPLTAQEAADLIEFLLNPTR